MLNSVYHFHKFSYRFHQRCYCGVSHKSSHFIRFHTCQTTRSRSRRSQETAINIGVATGLLAAEQGELERPMCLGDIGATSDQFGSVSLVEGPLLTEKRVNFGVGITMSTAFWRKTIARHNHGHTPRFSSADFESDGNFNYEDCHWSHGNIECLFVAETLGLFWNDWNIVMW